MENSYDSVPWQVKVSPAVIGGSLIGYLVSHDVAIAFGGLASASLLVGSTLINKKLYLLKERFKKNDKSGGVFAYEVEVESWEDFMKLLLFLRKRINKNNIYNIILYFRNNDIPLVRIDIVGSRAHVESEIFETAVSSFLTKIKIRKLNNIDKINNNGIYLGRRLDSPLSDLVFLSETDIEGHIGIFGGTGTGKSTTLRTLYHRMAELGYKVVVVDWTGEHSSAATQDCVVVNPLEGGLPVDILSCGFERGENVAVEGLVRALDLTEPQTYLLQRIIKQYGGSLERVYEGLDSIPEYSKWDREVKRALQRKIGLLLSKSVRKAFVGCGAGLLHAQEKSIIVDVSRIPGLYERRAYVLLFLSLLYIVHVERGMGVDKRVIFIDESHNVSSSIFNTILAESRKYGLWMVYATQSPALIGDSALLNTSTKIVHAIRSQKDKRVLLDSMGLCEEWMSRLDKLPRGTALLQSPSYTQPILVEIDFIR